jgi:hypothetical protein
MPTQMTEAHPNQALVFSLFCEPDRDGDAWCVLAAPAWLPDYLRPFFDQNLEAYPALLDFEDLDCHMRAHEALYEKRVSRMGGVELTARSTAAIELAVWLSTALASGTRPKQGGYG